jgi:predicted nucleic acid-binding protein
MTNSYFLDASYLIALAMKRDELHSRAVELSLQLEETGATFTTTHAVFLEVGSALSTLKHRGYAVELLNRLSFDPRIMILFITPALYKYGFKLFSERMDKEWSYCRLHFLCRDAATRHIASVNRG